VSLFYAPVFLGAAGVPMLSSVDMTRPLWVSVSTEQLGDDFWFKGYLRDPWA
jgi:hypothetical protein